MKNEKLSEYESCDLEDVYYPLFSLQRRVNESDEHSEDFKQRFNDVVKQLESFHD